MLTNIDPITNISSKFEQIRVEDGLSNSLVHDILHDHKGFMWFVTEDGVCKYDGYTFMNFFGL